MYLWICQQPDNSDIFKDHELTASGGPYDMNHSGGGIIGNNRYTIAQLTLSDASWSYHEITTLDAVYVTFIDLRPFVFHSVHFPLEIYFPPTLYLQHMLTWKLWRNFISSWRKKSWTFSSEICPFRFNQSEI